MDKIHYPSYDSLFNWDKLYSINPKEIKWALITNSWFDICKNEWYKVYNGDWDKKLEIEKDFVYSSVYNMFHNNVSFQNTSLYQTSVEQIQNGQCRWGYSNPEDFKFREGKLRDTFASIRAFGFQTQDELEATGHMTIKLNNKNVDDPGVIIDRDGRLLYHNANHRLPMFQILNIPEIKIKINVRHKEWVDFLLFVKKISNQMWGENKIYQPVNHIDFSDYQTEWGDYRYKIIKKDLYKTPYSILDIGALWGYFSSKFEQDGHSCTAVECNPDFVYIMDKLRIANDQTFTIFPKSIFELKENEFSVVLALNIFHHFLKKEETFNQLTAFLKNLDIKKMYFQAHQTNESQMVGAYKNFEPNEFVEYILNNSCLNNYQEIGEENGRKIYRLWRN